MDEDENTPSTFATDISMVQNIPDSELFLPELLDSNVYNDDNNNCASDVVIFDGIIVNGVLVERDDNSVTTGTAITDGDQSLPEHNDLGTLEPSEPELSQKESQETEKIGQEKKLTRKRKINKENWKSVSRKKLRQTGQKYVDKRNREHGARDFLYKECLKCPFKCSGKIQENVAKAIHTEFWSLSDNEKFNFYDKTTTRVPKKRVRNENKRSARPRAHSFIFNFVVSDKQVRVCPDFYLKILAISARRIAYFHSFKKEGITKTPKKDQRGKKTKIKIPVHSRHLIREHIESFPHVPSHYCRKNTKKEHLEFGFNLSKMYELYEENCANNNIIPVKKWLYSKIFNEEYNYSFYAPKKDQCDLCSEYDNRSKYNTLTEELEEKYRIHISEKEHAREEKNSDKAGLNEKKALICFDLQRVLSIPQSNIGKAYYLQKLNVFNLTGCDIHNRQGYCILWHEGLSGRTGNDIASALIQLLKKFTEEHADVKEIILWSGACVPQNRNSHMSTALLEFINDKQNNVEIIHQKFQEPGHSCVQEVDAIHSTIDRSFLRANIDSPLDLVRKLLRVRARKPYNVVQMKKSDFKNFQEVASKTNLKNVPYTKLKHIIYERGSRIVRSRTSFTITEFATCNIVPSAKNLRNQNSLEENILPSVPKVITTVKTIPNEKISAIKSLYSQFSPIDTQFWESTFNQDRGIDQGKSCNDAIGGKKTTRLNKKIRGATQNKKQ